MVVNGSLSKTAVNGGGRRQDAALRPLRRRPHGRHAAAPHGAVRVAARGDAGRRRDRRRDRARRLARAASRFYGDTSARSAAPTASPPGPTSSPPPRRMLGVLVFDTLPGLFIGIGVSLLLLLYRASRPYVATLGSPARRRSTSTSRATPTPSRPTASRSCASRAACTSPTPTRPHAAAAGRRGRARGDPRRRDDSLRRRHGRADARPARAGPQAARRAARDRARRRARSATCSTASPPTTALHAVYPSVRAAVDSASPTAGDARPPSRRRSMRLPEQRSFV